MASWKTGLILLLALVARAQPGDPKLESVRSRLPSGWEMLDQGGLVEFHRLEPVRVFWENRINAPVRLSSPAEQDPGQLSPCRLVLRKEPLWSAQKRNQARARNQAIESQMAKFSQRDRKGQALHPAELQALAAKRTPLPDFNSSRFSLFIVQREGIDDEYHRVEPPQASAELLAILATLRETAP